MLDISSARDDTKPTVDSESKKNYLHEVPASLQTADNLVHRLTYGLNYNAAASNDCVRRAQSIFVNQLGRWLLLKKEKKKIQTSEIVKVRIKKEDIVRRGGLLQSNTQLRT